MNKKGQAAMEFLTTYGWAFLVLIIMIAALVGFGVIDVSRLLPERCQFGTEMACTAYSANGRQILVNLKNSLTDTVTIDGMSYKVGEATSFTDCNGIAPAENPSVYPPGVAVGAGAAITCGTGANDLAAYSGKKTKIQVKVTYHTGSSSTYARDVHGDIYVNVR